MIITETSSMDLVITSVRELADQQDAVINDLKGK